MCNKKNNIAISIISLFLGGSIYVLYRENTYISNFIEEFINLLYIRSAFKPFECDFIKYYLPDYLWALSLISGLNALTTTKRKILKICLFVVLLGFVWEALQFFNILSGTGDISDILMYLAAATTAVIINFSNNKGEQKWKRQEFY